VHQQHEPVRESEEERGPIQRRQVPDPATNEEERDPNTIEVYVARLRKKLGRDVIKTQRGLGYRLG